MVEQQVAAILLILPRDFGRFNPEPIEAAGIPYVLVRRDDPDLICDKVVIDNVAVGEMATRALLSHGCRQPVFLGPLDYGTAWNRLRGFRQALRAAGIAYRAEDVLDTSRSELPPHEQVAPCVEQLISEQRPFDGICAFNDTHAANAVDVLVAHGIGVPGCVAVTGADDREFASRAVVPLTTIRFNAVQAGRDAAEMAMRRTEQPGERPRVVPIEAELVVRLSCPVPGSVQCDGMVG